MPFTVSFSSSAVDYCGSIGNIDYDEKDIHRGWVTGDIVYMTNGNWLSIFTAMQNSIVPGNLTLGHISAGYIDEVMDWKKQGNISVTFEITE